MLTFKRQGLVATVALALGLASAGSALAQQGRSTEGYLIDGRNQIVKDPYNLCWRTSYWTPALASVRHRIPYPICAVDSPGSTVAQDETAGVKLVLHYSLLLYAAHRAVREVLAAFRASGDRAALEARLTPEAEFDAFIGFPRIQALAARHGLR